MTKPENFCQHCGAPVGLGREKNPTRRTLADTRSKTAMLGVGAIIVAFAFLAIVASRNSTPTPPSSPPAASTPPATPTPATPPLTAEQRAEKAALDLAEAKLALADGYKPSGKDRAWGRVKDAREYLVRVLNNTDQSTKENKEAQKLLKEIERREAEIEKWAKLTARELFAQTAERNYLEKGMDVSLTLSGPDKTTIKFKYVLMSRPLVHQLTHSRFALVIYSARHVDSATRPFRFRAWLSNINHSTT